MKMLMNIDLKADISTGNPTGNSRCHTLALRALNTSCFKYVVTNQRARQKTGAWLFPLIYITCINEQ